MLKGSSKRRLREIKSHWQHQSRLTTTTWKAQNQYSPPIQKDLRRAKGHQHGSSQVSRSKKAPFNKPVPSANEENRKDYKLWHFKCNKAAQKELEEQLGKGTK